MTEGHKHREIYLHPKVLSFMQGVVVWKSKDVEKIDRSRFPYTGRTNNDLRPDRNGYWRLSLLGFLHGIFGLTVRVNSEAPRANKT